MSGKKNTAPKRYNPLHILCCNGWIWLSYEKDYLSTTDDLSQYKAEFLGRAYSSTVVALVAEHTDHLQLNGHYGVMWLEAIYENERNGCLSYEDMVDMQSAIIHAEENLLRIGMPFVPDYDFHGSNVANKKRRNDKNRRMYNMDEVEKKAWEREEKNR